MSCLGEPLPGVRLVFNRLGFFPPNWLFFEVFAMHINLAEVTTAEKDELAHAIGIFTIEFACLERSANHAIAVFLKLPTIRISDLVFAAIRNVSARLDILQSLVSGMVMSDHHRSEMRAIIAEIRDLNVYRNWLVHDAWGGRSPDNGEWLKRRPRTDKALHYQSDTFLPKSILEKAGSCSELIKRMYSVWDGYSEERLAREASRETPD